jgi:hypothetical protein
MAVITGIDEGVMKAIWSCLVCKTSIQIVRSFGGDFDGITTEVHVEASEDA